MILVPTNRLYLQGIQPMGLLFYLSSIDFGDSDEVERREMISGDQLVILDPSIGTNVREYTCNKCSEEQISAFRTLVHTYLGKLVRLHDYTKMCICQGLITSYEVTDGNRKRLEPLTYTDGLGDQHQVPYTDYIINFVFEALDYVTIEAVSMLLPGAYHG